jgi:hypothetical protein
MKKSDFLKLLLTVSPEQINRIIKEKGKEPKLVRGVIYDEE